MSNLSQRDSFWTSLYGIARQNTDVVVISADMGAPALDSFRKDIPNQYINVGIAEQNAVTLAAGLALTGKKVFTYAIAPFITLRCLEQIRVENGIMNIPITIVGVGAGFGYPDSGPTHHLIEDIAIMRAIPNITIHSMTDGVMAGAFAEISCSMKNTNYVRLERQDYPDLYGKETDFSQGLATLRKGKDVTVIATGSMTHGALAVAERLGKKGIDAGVIDVYTFPVNEKGLLDAVAESEKIITLEEHFLPGGLGGAIAEILVDNGVFKPVKRLGLSHEKGYCYTYGGRELIRGYYDLAEEDIERRIIRFLQGER